MWLPEDFPSLSSLHILQRHALAGPQALAGRLDASEQPRVALQAVLEPLILGGKSDQHAGRLAVARDDDFLLLGLVQVAREVVPDLRERNGFHPGFPTCVRHEQFSDVGVIAKISTLAPATSCNTEAQTILRPPQCRATCSRIGNMLYAVNASDSAKRARHILGKASGNQGAFGTLVQARQGGTMDLDQRHSDVRAESKGA